MLLVFLYIGSPEAEAHPDDDLYDGNHGRYVLTMSPGQDPMNILPFGQVYYDKRDHVMKAKDESRPSDFIEISGSKMRKLAAQGAVPCDVSHGKEIPSDLLGEHTYIPIYVYLPAHLDIHDIRIVYGYPWCCVYQHLSLLPL